MAILRRLSDYVMPFSLRSWLGLSSRNTIASVVIVANALAWYFVAFDILARMMNTVRLTSYETFGVWTVNLASAALFVLLGAKVTSRTQGRRIFLLLWMSGGAICSLIPSFLPIANSLAVYIDALVLGASLGVGLPAAMANFSDSTSTDNRARISGLTFLTFGMVILSMKLLMDTTTITRALIILATWRMSALFIFLLVDRSKEILPKSETNPSFSHIFKKRAFVLYFVPWTMFCLVNQTISPILNAHFGATFVNPFTLGEFALSGLFAFISGFFCDRIGRKRVAAFGLTMMGIGYAVLGVLPQITFAWYFYTLANGVAWGIFYTVFFLTVWGDITHNAASDKCYALGMLPYLFSTLVSFTIGQYISVSLGTIFSLFSLASFFIFLAVLPIMYAPETLSEKRIQNIEIRSYIEKAEKIKQKS